MEKRKVYKISIIDKEISRTEFDRNTFYTSDSELTLVFKLIEKDYSYDHGEILLYNENDKSFVTRKITKQENDFVYEIDSDIIPHYGTWKAQLQLVNDGDVYTSKPFEFKIINDLSNLAPQPTLTDINNWSTLKKNAAELIEEMKNVIDDIKKAESKHENAERIRQSQENSRVQSESERQSQERLRSQGESQRQSQENKRLESENERRLNEIDRNKNESNRQTIFENNEVRRKETFNTNEETRQVNETTRQQAESQRQYTFETNETERQTTFETAEQERQSAELIRVENEATRQANETERKQALGDMNGLYERIYPVSKNLFNHNKLTFGGRLDRNTGRIINSDKDCYTEFISVKENTPYTISKQGEPYSAVSYDSDYNYIKGYLLGGTFGNTTLNTPINASFLRFSFLSNSEYEKIMLNEGNEILPFEEYQDQENNDKTVAGVFNYLLDNYFNL